MKTSLTVKSDNWRAIEKGLLELSSLRLMVGVPSDRANRELEGQTINNAALAYIHENGAPEAHIPARPFMKPTVAENKDTIEKGMKAAADAALSGKGAEGVRKALTALGLRMQAAVRRKITTGPFAPLAESTLAARRRRGRKGTKPLIDTGQLRNAINFVIKKVK